MSNSTVLHITKSVVGIAALCLLAWSATATDVAYDVTGRTCLPGDNDYCQLSSYTLGSWFPEQLERNNVFMIADDDDHGRSREPRDVLAYSPNVRWFFGQGFDPDLYSVDDWVRFNLQTRPTFGTVDVLDYTTSTPVPIPPEPSSLLLTVIGLLGITVYCSLRRRPWRSVGAS
jgi:hypothetical protein